MPRRSSWCASWCRVAGGGVVTARLPSDLGSAGAALGARQEWETRLARDAGRVWPGFLAVARREALEGGSWGAVHGAWSALAVAVVAAMAGLLGEETPRVATADPGVSPWPESPVLSGQYARLMEDDTPSRVWDTASSVVLAGVAAGMSARVLRRELTDIVGPGGGPAVHDGLSWSIRRGGWDGVPALLARDAATTGYGAAVLARAASDGASMKRWVTRRDERVRASHAAADGQAVPVGSPFLVGGWPMMAPGDVSAPPSETARCRCVIITA